jgi:hypothetical protein
MIMKEFILILVVFFIFFRLFRKSVFIYVHKPQDSYRETEVRKEEEGSIRIHKVDNKNQNKSGSGGDYIDYEEVN